MGIRENRNIRWGVILSYVSFGISLIGTFLITNRVLNLIGDYNYGLYSFVNSITTWLTVVSSALIASYIRFTSLEAIENNGDVSRTNTLYLKMLLILGCFVLFFGLGTIGVLYGLHINFGKYEWEDSKLIYLLFVFSILNIAITLPVTIFTQFINYKKEFIYERLLLIFTTIATFTGHFLIAFFTKNILLISVYSIVLTIINFLINFVFCKKRLGISFEKTYFNENKTLIRAIVLFSSVLVINSIVDQINSQVDKTLLGIFSTPENVTIYQMGMQFGVYLTTLTVAVSSVYVPQIYDLYANNRLEEVNRLFLRVSRVQAIVVTFVAFGFVACGYDFILWWLGKNRIYAYYCGVVLMLMKIMPLSVKLSIEIQRAANKHKFRSLLYVTVAVLNVLLSILLLVLLPENQAIFACLIGTVVSGILCHWIAMNIYNKKVMKLPIEKHLFQVIKQIAFGVASAGVIILIFKYCFNSMESVLLRFLIEGISYVFVYVVLLLVFDRRFIFSFIKKRKA